MIEQDLKRIADALEGILGVINKAALPTPAPKVETSAPPSKGIGAVPPLAPVVPPVAKTPGVPDQAPTNWPTNPEELRTMAQKIAQKLGPKTLDFTAFVTKELKAIGVETMLAVPVDQITALATKMGTYAREKGINV